MCECCRWLLNLAGLVDPGQAPSARPVRSLPAEEFGGMLRWQP
jgi:hypothetical protein